MKVQEAVVVRLHGLIDQNNISIRNLAMMAAIPPSTIKNILNGKSNNTGIVTLAKICDGFEISIQEFMNDPVFHGLEQEIQ